VNFRVGPDIDGHGGATRYFRKIKGQICLQMIRNTWISQSVTGKKEECVYVGNELESVRIALSRRWSDD